MATLFNTKISQTYEGLLKTIDNAAISATLRELTDGSGNQSGLYLNTAGDFKVTSVLEWGSLKDTGTGVTITRFVTSTDGIENFDNNTSLPTSAAVKLYVDTKFSQTDTLTEVLGFGNTTSGKDIAVSAGDDITFTDSSKILMGAGSDLQIYHDGSNSYIIDAGTGGLTIQANADFALQSTGTNENFITAATNAFVKLYFNGNEKLATTNTGVDVTGNLVVSGTITGSGGSFLPLAGGTMTGATNHGDNVKAIFGTGGDLEIYHNSLNSYIENDSGDLYIKNNFQDRDIILQSDNGGGGTATYIQIDGSTGKVELSHYGSKKFETTEGGTLNTGTIDSTGTITVTGSNGNVGINTDSGKLLLGASYDLQIYHDGSNSYIKDTGSGGLRIATNQFRVYNAAQDNLIINAVENGAVELYFNDSKKIETLTAGAKVTGNLEVTGTITGSGGSFLPLAGGTMTGNTIHNDNVKSIYGTSGDGLEIYHDGSFSYIEDTGTGDLRIKSNGTSIAMLGNANEDMLLAIPNGAVNLYYNNSKKFETTSTGISVTGDGAFSGNVTITNSGELRLGNSSGLQLLHGGTLGLIRNSIGDLYIDQSAVTQSIIFRVSNANSNDTTALTINREGDLTTGADVTIAGNLTVNGTTTTINTQTLAVEDPLIELSKDNAANSVDIGFYGKYNDGTARYLGLFSDASDSNKFRLFKGTTVEPTTTVNIGGAGYVAADLVVAGLEAATGVFTGALSSVGFTSSNINTNQLTTATANGNIKVRNNAGSTITTFNNDRSVNFEGSGTFGGNLSVTTSSAGVLNVASFIHQEGGSLSDITLKNSAGANNSGFAINFQLQSSGSSAAIQAVRTNSPSAGSTDLKFETNGVERLKLDASGNASFTGDVSLADNKKLKIGTGSDIQIFHDTSSNFIDSYNQSLFLRSLTADKDIIFQADNGSGGIENYIQIDGSEGRTTFNKNIRLNDGVKAQFGGSGDLQIYHDGSNSYIEDYGTGNLIVRAATSFIAQGINQSNFIIANQGGGVNLYYNNANKLDTTNIGINVTGQIDADTGRILKGSEGLYFSAGGDSANGRELQFTSSNGGSNGSKHQINARSSNGVISLATANVDALTIDNSQNSTFAGDVRVGEYQVGSQGGQTLFGALSSFANSEANNLFLGLRNGSYPNRGYGFQTVAVGVNSDFRIVENGGGTGEVFRIQSDGNLRVYDVIDNITNTLTLNGRNTGEIHFQSGGSEKMRITSGGDVLISTTTALTTSSTYGNLTLDGSMTVGPNLGALTPDASINVKEFGGKQISFFYGTTKVGGITSTSSATAYNTSSDYRLKEDLQDFAGLDMVSKIPVYDFKWKTDESRSYGVMAHELQDVLPDAVSGDKDAEEMQSVDYSKIVPLLVKSIQELTAKVEKLESQNCKCKI